MNNMEYIKMDTLLSEVWKLEEKYPELKDIIEISNSELNRRRKNGGGDTIESLGERTAYNTMISLNLILNELSEGRRVLYPDFLGFLGHPGKPCCIVIHDGDFQKGSLFASDAVAAAVELDKLSCNVIVQRFTGEEVLTAKMLIKAVERSVRFIQSEECRQERIEVEYGEKRSGRAYALFGFGNGGWLAGLWGTAEHGFRKAGLPAPGALVMAFAPTSVQMDESAEQYNISCLIDHDFPPVFLIHGTADEVVSISDSQCMAQRLAEKGVRYCFIPVEGAPHGFGKGHNTRADGWLEKAVKFWKEAVI